jgi:non-specific protein-tyrosine kinase
MELRQYLTIIGKWMWLVVLSVIIAGGASYFASKAATPLYRTKTTLMVGRTTQNPDPTTSDFSTGQQLASTYVQLARREPVLRGVIDSLGLQVNWQSLAGQVSSAVIPQTQLIEVGVIDSDPYRAKVLADAIAEQLILQSPTGSSSTNQEIEFIRSQISDLKEKIESGQNELKRLQQELDSANSASQIQNLQNQINVLDTKISGWQDTYSQLLVFLEGGNVNALTVIEEATIPSAPISPNTMMNVLLASVIGIILAVGGAFIVEYLDDTIKTELDVERTARLPTLGGISRIKGGNYKEKLIAVREPLSPAVEAYRVLRTNIQYSEANKHLQTLMITGAGPSEGKSICLANLGVVMAQSGLKVIIVDADLRRPVQHEIFGLSKIAGLSDALLNIKSNVKDYIKASQQENLRILTSGFVPPNPAELLGSRKMGEIIEELKSEADIILFDSPPTLVVADSRMLSYLMDGVIIVNDAGHTRTSEAKRAADELRKVQSNLLGVVINHFPTTNDGYYYYRYQENGRIKH